MDSHGPPPLRRNRVSRHFSRRFGPKRACLTCLRSGSSGRPHDALYANAPKASPEQLKANAQEVGLDLSSFEACLNSGKHQAGVQKDIEEGTGLGVSGTPTFFINGRLLSGAQPLEAFVRLIEEELAQTR